MHTMYVGTYIYSLAPGQLVFIDDPYAYVCKAWEKIRPLCQEFSDLPKIMKEIQ